MPLSPVKVDRHDPPRCHRLIVDDAQNAVIALRDPSERVSQAWIAPIRLGPFGMSQDSFDPGQVKVPLADRYCCMC